ncbi:MAG: hypothetical protein RL367_1785, partial [Pseudomonadota bacterium]
MDNVKLLTGLKVVDFGVGMAAAIAAKLLADSGAQVVRVDPVGGDPFVASVPAYPVLRRGARPGSLADLADADICIIGGDDHPGLARRRDASDLSARFPRLVILDITDGPAGTGYTGPSTELLAQVRSGLAFEQRPDRPIVNAFEPATYGAALQGVAGILAALIAREATGAGQVVTTSLFEGALVWIGSYWAQLEKPTPVANFIIPRGVYPLIFKAKDGVFIHMAIGGAGSKYGFYQALEIDDPSVKPSDSGMPAPGAGPRDFFGDYDLLAAHVAKKDSADLLARIWETGLPAEPVQHPGACWDDPQITRNGIIVTDDDGTRHVGLPFIAAASGTGAGKRAKSGKGPLTGLRVIDCGAFVAGPLAAVALADLGADVIKVEAKQGDPNRSIFRSFTVANRSKRVIGVDMKAPDGLAIVQALCRDADVVMNNFRPGVSARLGVDPKSLFALNPNVIALEAPAYGSEGPLALKAGFDMVMQAWVGHEAKAAGTGNDPRWNRTNLVDVAAAQLGTIALLSALLHRERTGQSVALESPLCNAGIFTLSELIQHTDGRFEGVPQLSSSLAGYHPAECLYAARDGWIAIVARGEKAALALRQALNVALPDDVAAWGEAEEALVAAKLATLDAAAIKALLEPHSIWVEICHDDCERTILNDPALIARGTVRTSQHASFGQINELGTLFHLSANVTGNDLAAPLPGQQTREILAQLDY